ncbi:MAG: hypothetical protein ACJ8AG_08220 [Ktedonobacteraceae bacterium]
MGAGPPLDGASIQKRMIALPERVDVTIEQEINARAASASTLSFHE